MLAVRGSDPQRPCKALDKALATSADAVSGKLVERYVWHTHLMTGYLDWTTVRTVVRVCNVTTDKTTGERTVEDHYYLSSLRHTISAAYGTLSQQPTAHYLSSLRHTISAAYGTLCCRRRRGSR
ncbi:MAG: hypothetical protein EXR77_06470 [Myxococcales bacterium]|nr:hypothetical protein [Myxococcales bacterium]